MKRIKPLWNMKDLVGVRFGRLQVLSEMPYRTKGLKRLWLCMCDCGVTREVTTDHLTTGHTKSCGCLSVDTIRAMRTKHGKSNKTPEYKAWMEMRQRCSNENNQAYPYYGGRGISVCDRWVDSFENFLVDMGNRPHKGMSLDRVDVNKGYSRENCRWATRTEQSRNRRNVPKYTVGDRSLTLPEWAEVCGISRGTLWQRVVVLGWGIEKAISTQVQTRKEETCSYQ